MGVEAKVGSQYRTVDIPQSSVREAIGRVRYKYKPDDLNCERELADVAGLVIYRSSKEFEESDRCVEFAFEEEIEKWPRGNITLHAWPLRRLEYCGYQPLFAQESPRPGDVVVYRRQADVGEQLIFLDLHIEPDELIAVHFGIYLGDGMVRSKFGPGAAFDHPLEVIPPGYGDSAIFVRKVIL